jgi:hypothetical protein
MHVPNELRTRELCLAAVRQFGWSLMHVPNELRTREMCLVAVRQNMGAIRFVPQELKNQLRDTRQQQ